MSVLIAALSINPITPVSLDFVIAVVLSMPMLEATLSLKYFCLVVIVILLLRFQIHLDIILEKIEKRLLYLFEAVNMTLKHLFKKHSKSLRYQGWLYIGITHLWPRAQFKPTYSLLNIRRYGGY